MTVIGSGEAFSHGLGNTSHILSGDGAPTLLFDCGYQIPERLWEKEIHSEIDGIALTHLHADHAFGLVPLLARYWEEKRRRALTIFGPPGTEAWLKRLFDLGYPGMMKRFKYEIEFKTLREGRILSWQGLRLGCARTQHSVLNHMIRVDSEKGRLRSFAVSGDGKPTEASKKLAQGVQVLLQECYHGLGSSPVHASLRDLQVWLKNADVAEVRITHLSRIEAPKIRKLSNWKVSKSGDRIRL